jgi:membrane associated rhomboid family serine protease
MIGYSRGFGGLPPVVKNLLLINLFMLLADFTVERVMGIRLSSLLGLHFVKSEAFKPLQVVTHIFMHGGFPHLFMNMFTLFMFGRILEQVWGPKRFLIFYMVCGLGAAFIHEIVIAFNYARVMNELAATEIQTVLDMGREYFLSNRYFTNPGMRELQMILNVPTVGASGAVFGILMAFGMLFPNTQLMLLFPPIPMKAKYLVIGLIALELYLAVTQPGSNIAHAAHLGGVLFAYILLRIWRRNTKTLY